MSTQERRTEASRKLLIDTALQIIGSDGLRGLTVARLEAVSGASWGLVGYHFGSKRGLLAATIRRAHRIVAASPDLADAGGATDAEATLQIARGYLAQLGRDPRGHRAILALMSESVAAQPQLQEPIWALNAALRDGIGRQRERGLADGSVRGGIDPADAFAIAGLLRGIALQWLVDPALDLSRAAESAVAVVRRAYA